MCLLPGGQDTERRPTGRPAPSLLPGDEDLAEGAIGKGGERLVRPLERDRHLDVDPKPARGNLVEQRRELAAGSDGHDRRNGDVGAAESLGAGAESGSQNSSGPEGLAELCDVAGGVEHLVDAVWGDGSDRGGN